MITMPIAALGVAAVLLAACAGGAEGLPGRGGRALGRMALDDVRAAAAYARAVGDEVGARCFEALVPLAERLAQPPADGAIAGAFSALAHARGARVGVGRGSALHAVCAPLLLDEAQTIARLSAIAGGGGALSLVGR